MGEREDTAGFIGPVPCAAQADHLLSRFDNSQMHQNITKLPKEIRNILAGGIAGMIAKSIVAPFDRIKILFQISSAEFSFQKVPLVALRIIKHEGLGALWKGNTATMIRVFPYSGIQFMVYDRCKTFLLHEQEAKFNRQLLLDPSIPRPKWGLSPQESLMAGMLAGAVSVVCTYPLDLARVQLAVLKQHKDRTANSTITQVLRDNYHHRGFAGLFRGISPTVFGILPYSGLAFAFNEQGKRKIQELAGRDVTTMERMQCGAFSGLVAQTLTYPCEIVRRRMQTIGVVATSGHAAAVAAAGKAHHKAQVREKVIRELHPEKPPTLTAIITELYAEQGVRGFFKGVALNWFKGPIAFSISFTAFDTVQMLLETEAERDARLPSAARRASK
eukprot:Nitzschia sp. Nitz4//scaffold2_size372955//317031//318366//NITZ4_000464-RA/size372955-snap-gene-0.106-mRNA-1//-1//CDS//3329546901//8590//frame0